MNAAALLRAAAARLPGDTPRLDAELLLAHALGIDRGTLLLDRAPVPPEAVARFEALVACRAAHEPVAWLTGSREFWSLPLAVSPDVLIPRPDSETLIEVALELCGARAPSTILDLGTGSGALLLAALAEWPNALGVGVDRSAAAVAVARHNARALGFGDRAGFLVSDWGAALDARFDLLLANPPYVETGAALSPEVRREPAAALFAGADGLDAYRAIAPQLSRLLAPQGLAVIEIGATQAEAFRALAAAQGLETTVHHDLAGRPRAVAARRAWQAPGKPVSTGSEKAAASGNRPVETRRERGQAATLDKLETCGGEDLSHRPAAPAARAEAGARHMMAGAWIAEAIRKREAR